VLVIRIKLDWITAAFGRLSGREQVTTLLSALGLIFLISGLGTWLVSRDLKSREHRIASKMDKLEKLTVLKNDYQRRLQEQNRLASDIKNNNKTRLLSYLEEISKQSSVELGNASEGAGEPTGSDLIKEVSAKVNIKSVSIDRLYDFLRRIEEGNRLVKIRRLKIKTRFDNAKMLDAEVTVGTYKTAQEAGT
jgi:F0F1-type ATP synthase membrane subunit b/b'